MRVYSVFVYNAKPCMWWLEKQQIGKKVFLFFSQGRFFFVPVCHNKDTIIETFQTSILRLLS